MRGRLPGGGPISPPLSLLWHVVVWFVILFLCVFKFLQSVRLTELSLLLFLFIFAPNEWWYNRHAGCEEHVHFISSKLLLNKIIYIFGSPSLVLSI